MLKTYKLFESELDPYNEEDWDNIVFLTQNEEINVGDIIYWRDDMKLGTVTNVVDDFISLDISEETVKSGWSKNNKSLFSKKHLIRLGLKIKHV